jgi:D-alanyl-lipoteichoic acid acyltransferase DltB (MBOAT superfamily)
MLFNSYQFIFAFLPAVCLAYFVAARFTGVRGATAVLAAASLVFYGWWHPRFTWVLLGSIGCNAVCIVALVRGAGRPRCWLLAGLTFNLLLLGYFKYAGFLAANAGALLGFDWHVENPSLPLGISFFTFQKIAFLVDAYAGGVASFSLLNYSLFVTFFPQLIAGPIARHHELIPQFEALPTAPRAGDFAIGLSLFAIGLFKKTCLADPSAAWVAPAFAGGPVGFADAWIGALAYSFQIYFDFSGYSDMAVGLARLFGIILPLNFFSPYQAVDIIDFWRRWNITLSRFLRDYVYVPLGGNRRGVPRRYVNLMLTMLIGGLWHGASWTFVLWGGVHGLLLSVNHAWHALRRRAGVPPGRTTPAGRVVARALTFVAVTSAWVLFRAPTLASARNLLAAMYGLDGHGVWSSVAAYGAAEWTRLSEFTWSASSALWLLFVGVVAFAFPNSYQLFESARPALTERPFAEGPRGPVVRWTPDWKWAVGLALMLLTAILRIGELAPFIYFQF